MVGINPKESNRFNWKIAMGFLLSSFNIFLFCIFIFSIEVNDNLLEFVNAFCSVSALVEMGICLAALVCHQMKLLEFIRTIESLINKSNSFDWLLNLRSHSLADIWERIKLNIFRIRKCTIKGDLYVCFLCASVATMCGMATICD